MNAVGIDVSKRKSTVTIRQPGDKVVLAPRDYRHTQSSINELIATIKSLDGETKVCMEHTGRYYEAVASWLSAAGIFVSAVNPWLIKDFGNDSIRAPKTDKADAKKIARFTLDRWAKLRQYSRMDELRNQLKTMNRQFGFYMDQKTAMKNNLIALLDQTFPGANSFFDSPARPDGSQKWVDFVYTYWHVDCVRGKSLAAFTEHYKSWCKRKGYNFSASKAEEVYRAASDLIAVFPKDDNTKMLVRKPLKHCGSRWTRPPRRCRNMMWSWAWTASAPRSGPSSLLRLATLPGLSTEARSLRLRALIPARRNPETTSAGAIPRQRKARRICGRRSFRSWMA